MRAIFVVLLAAFFAFFIGQWWANAGTTLCDGKALVNKARTIAMSDQRCTKQAFKQLLELGNEVDVCQKLLQALDKLNYMNGTYKPVTFNQWLALNDLDTTLTFTDFVSELKQWHKSECNGSKPVKRSINVITEKR